MHSISASSCNGGGDCPDPMVKIEIEAAEALAGLAQFSTTTATNTRESSESGTTKWGSKGKRARGGGRVKSQSPQIDSPDLAAQNSQTASMEYDQIEEMHKQAGTKKAKVKVQPKSPNTSSVCYESTMSFGGSRSRKNLTEAEKEEKRLRRVLANRESARQTIRRRQALHEELSRKASDLLMENANLKREKELALEKLRSLKSDNEILKAKMAQSLNPVREENFLQVVQNVKPKVEQNLLQMSLDVKPVVEENLELKLAHPDVSTPSESSLTQFTPYMIPPVVHSLNADKAVPGPLVAVPATLPMFASGLSSSLEQKPYNMGAPLTPVYILPYPWFLPVPYQTDGEAHNESPTLDNCKQSTAGVISSCNGVLSSNKGTGVEDYQSVLSLGAKAEVSGPEENGSGSTSNGAPFLCVADGVRSGAFRAPADGGVPSNASHPMYPLSNIKPEQWSMQDTSQLEGRSLSPSPQMNKETAFFFPLKIADHAVAAAEARKRRKELTRFKNIPGRQLRLPC